LTDSVLFFLDNRNDFHITAHFFFTNKTEGPFGGGDFLSAMRIPLLIFGLKVGNAIISDQAPKRPVHLLELPTQILRAAWHQVFFAGR